MPRQHHAEVIHASKVRIVEQRRVRQIGQSRPLHWLNLDDRSMTILHHRLGPLTQPPESEETTGVWFEIEHVCAHP